jgi:Effector Associated Constant Component 1
MRKQRSDEIRWTRRYSCHLSNGGAMELSVSVSGEDAEAALAALTDRLRREPEFDGRITLVGGPPQPSGFGAIDFVSIVVGSAGSMATLAGSLKAFLAHRRRPDLRITVRAPDGRSIEINATRVADVEALLAAVVAGDVSRDPASDHVYREIPVPPIFGGRGFDERSSGDAIRKIEAANARAAGAAQESENGPSVAVRREPRWRGVAERLLSMPLTRTGAMRVAIDNFDIRMSTVIASLPYPPDREDAK